LEASFALSQDVVTTAAAEEAAFRAPAPQAFSTADLQNYGLSASDAAQVAQLQEQGYQVQVMTTEEAEATYGGQWSQGTWIAVGVIALVVIAVAVAGD
jgi:hypothetical protein